MIAYNPDTGWTAMERHVEKPTRRDAIEAASEMSECVGWGEPDGSCEEFRELVRAMRPVRLTKLTGEDALNYSCGEYDEYFLVSENGELAAWEVHG